jgi:Fe-S-cluster-containing hydrogenase component 2
MSENPDDIYSQLADYLDTLPIGFPRTKSGVEIRVLKHIFDPEEASIALKLSLIPVENEKLYKRKFKNSNMSLEELKEKLEIMAQKGAIFRARKDGEPFYSLALLAVGMFEYQLNRLSNEFANDFKQYMEEAFIKEFTATKLPQLRVIPIEKSVEHINYIGTYDMLTELINNERGKIAVSECICRKLNDLKGYHCNHIREACLILGGAAEYYIENKLGREISKEEALEISRKAQEEGLVIQPGNTQRPFSICACCGCCCEVLSNMNKFEKPVEFFQSNHYAEVDSDLCTSCGVCVERCQINAISLDNGTAEVNLDRCIGCGACVPTCPVGAIQLKKKDQEVSPPRNTAELYMKIGEIKSKLRASKES